MLKKASSYHETQSTKRENDVTKRHCKIVGLHFEAK
jgi:hypothetical protein